MPGPLTLIVVLARSGTSAVAISNVPDADICVVAESNTAASSGE
jgi:hypothetical protein